MIEAIKRAGVRSLAMRLSTFAILWLLLTEGDSGAWPFGIPVVAVASYASLRLVPVFDFRPLAIPGFLPVFLWRSLAGAWDVARRALRPDRPLGPELTTYETRLPSGLPTVFFANTVSLLPGTLSADLNGTTLTVHVLDDVHSALDSMATLESAVEALFAPVRDR